MWVFYLAMQPWRMRWCIKIYINNNQLSVMSHTKDGIICPKVVCPHHTRIRTRTKLFTWPCRFHVFGIHQCFFWDWLACTSPHGDHPKLHYTPSHPWYFPLHVSVKPLRHAMDKGRWEHFPDQNPNNPSHAHTMIKNKEPLCKQWTQCLKNIPNWWALITSYASHMIKQKKIRDWIVFTLMFIILIEYHQQWNKMVVNLAPLQVFFGLNKFNNSTKSLQVWWLIMIHSTGRLAWHASNTINVKKWNLTSLVPKSGIHWNNPILAIFKHWCQLHGGLDVDAKWDFNPIDFTCILKIKHIIYVI